MKKKYTFPILLILVLSFFISAPTQSMSEDSPNFHNDTIEIKNIEKVHFNESLIINNNTNFYDKSIKYNWTGNGTEEDPFLITDYYFNMNVSRTAVYIENTDVHFVLKNCNITNSSCGIVLSQVKNGTIQDNTFYNSDCGVKLFNSQKNTVDGNDFKNINIYSIFISGKSYMNRFHNNSMFGPGFYFEGDKSTYISQVITKDNTVNDKPVLYHSSENFDNESITDEVGQIIISDCSYLKISDLSINNTNIGITISYSNHLSLNNLNVSQNAQEGIRIIESNNIKISKLNSSYNYHGLYLRNVKNSTISDNVVSNNKDRGISLIFSENNILKNNKISKNQGNGIDIYSSAFNSIKKNIIVNNDKNGINIRTFQKADTESINVTDYSSNNTILNNLIKSNQKYGVKLSQNTENNMIYLNSFVKNQGSNETYDQTTIQAYEEIIDETNDNHWNSQDDLGNYWEDWKSPDENDDYIVDEPYSIDGGSAQDKYPLISYLSPVSRFSTSPGKEDIKLTWDEPTYSVFYPVSQYKLYKGLGKKNISLYKIFNTSTYSCIDNNVTSEHTYYYQIRAVNSKGDVSKSKIISSSPDNIPPEIISHSPKNEEVHLDTNITIEFSERMLKDSVKLDLTKDDEKINGTIRWDKNSFTFDPEETLEYKTTYTVIVNGKDLAGNNLSTYEWNFKTEVVTAVTGKIVDQEGKPILNVSIKSDTGNSTTTDTNGEFELILKPGKRILNIEKDGYEDKKIEVDVGSEKPKKLDNIHLRKTDSSTNNWFLPLAIFGTTTTILAVIAIIAFFKEQEELEEEIQDEEEFFKDLYEDEFEEVSEEEFESWWEDKK